jgi:hypothetical protein
MSEESIFRPYIPVSSTCSTKELLITMTKILHAVKGGLLSYCDKVYSRGNINQKHPFIGIFSDDLNDLCFAKMSSLSKLVFCKVYQSSWKYHVLHIARLALNNNHLLHELTTLYYIIVGTLYWIPK